MVVGWLLLHVRFENGSWCESENLRLDDVRLDDLPLVLVAGVLTIVDAVWISLQR